ncbi:hypothetical protein OAF16_01475 [Flavobacteriales bacterium]|nr:hypothetical protein [Flavobacteriales bacterium]
MRKTILYILISFISTCLYAQAPEKINYQAVVRDGNGNILPNTSVPITIDVVNGVNTCSVYSGSQTTNSYGLINIELDLSACTIDWSTGTATLSSSINSISGTSNLNSVPYSIYSSISDSTANYPKSATDGDILVWSATNGQWEATTNSGGSSSSISDADGNTKVETEATSNDNIIHFETDGSERMVINANGKVGIGTNSPSSYLEIKSDQDGAFTLNKDGVTAWNYIQYKNSGTRYFYTGVTNLEKFVFGSDNGEPFYFTGSKVGISLNDPKANLDVQDTLRVSREDRQYTEIINSSAAGAIIQAVSGQANKKPLSIDALYETGTSTAGANQIRFRTGEISSPSIKMTIDEDGEVGIGTTTPDYKLDVRGDLGIKNESSSRTNLKLINSSSSQYSRGSLSFINSNTASGIDDNGFSINYEKADASSTGNSTVIFRQGETNSDYLDYLHFSETTKNITFNANKSSTSTSSFGDVIVEEGNLQLNTGASVNEFSTDGTLSGNSDNALPTEQAVKTYVDNNQSSADGSETIVSAGTNVFVSGTGTTLDPYVVSSTDNDSQTLEEVLTLGNSAASNKITNLTDPSSAQDAATKNYVDNDISHQDISGSNLDGNTLTIGISDGQSQTVDLSGMLACNVSINEGFSSETSCDPSISANNCTFPTDWSRNDINFVWIYNISPNNNKCVGIRGVSSWFKTPSYNTTSCNVIRISFDHRAGYSGSSSSLENGDDLILKYYNGSTWVTLTTIDHLNTSENSWNNESIELTTGMNENFQIEFSTTCNAFDDSWLIDNVSIESSRSDYDWVINNNDMYSGYNGNIGIGTSTPSTKLDVVGNTSISGTLNMNSNIISNITDPISNQDASTKKYVDDLIANSETNTSLSAGNDISSSSLNNNTIALEDDIDVSTISASASGGVQIKDDGGNLGIHVDDGGNVGVNTINPDYKLDVNGDARIGWHGDAEHIYITPFDVKPYFGYNYNYGSYDVNSFGNNGGNVKYQHYDMLIPVYIPIGYKMTGCVMNFNNPPDDIYIYSNFVNGSGNVQIAHDSSPAILSTLNLTSNQIYGGGFEFATIRFSNDSGNICEFEGGYITIERQ